MGIYDRDYYREGSGSLFGDWPRPGVTVWLIVVTGLAFVGQIGSGHVWDNPLVALAACDPRAVQNGQLWRLLTALFLHADLVQLLCNLLVLYWAGRRFEETYGRTEILAYYLLAGGLGMLGYTLVVMLGLAAPRVVMGASGAVTALLAYWACRNPRETVLLFFLVPVPLAAVVGLYILFDLWGAVRTGRGTAVSLIHGFAVVFATVYYFSGIRLGRLGSRFRPAPSVRPSLRVVPPSVPDDDPPTSTEPTPPGRLSPEPGFEERIDQILAKVSRQGQDSLTPEERAMLVRASEMYRRRRG